MKKLITVTTTALLLLGMPAAFPEERAELYNQANRLYIMKEYRQAHELYRELVDRGIEHPFLYYNLANTSYKLGYKGEAVLYYERALRLRPLDREIRANLRLVKKSLDDQITPLYNEGFTRFYTTLLSAFTLSYLAFLELGFFVLTVGLFAGALLFPALRGRLRGACVVSGVFLVLAFSGMLVRRHQERNRPRAVVMEEQVQARASPIAESEELFALHEGAGIRIIEQRGEWVRFQLADGREGWLLLRSVRPIEPDALL
ncbi:MAG: tetratricopeptide repeat protein [Spirochaetota bacterium]